MGRIRLGRLPDASGLSLRRFIEANVEPGTVVVTDAWGGSPIRLQVRRLRAPRRRRAPLHAQGHQPERHHRRRPHRLPARAPSRRPRRAGCSEPTKAPSRWATSTPTSPPTSDGCVFRFNRRTSSNRGLLFWRLVCGPAWNPPLTRTQLRSRQADVALDDDRHFDEWEDFKAERLLAQARVRAAQRRDRAAQVKAAVAAGQEPPPELPEEDHF